MISHKLFRAALFIPLLYWLYLIAAGALGADPVKHLNHLTGRMSLYYLLANLFLGMAIALQFPWGSFRFLPGQRRWIGVIGFSFLCLHFSSYHLMEGFELKAWEQMISKTYLIVASLAFLILLMLAVTSNNFSARKLGGKKWKRLHRTVHIAMILICIHALSIEKADVEKYTVIFSIYWMAQAVRWSWPRLFRKKQPQ